MEELLFINKHIHKLFKNSTNTVFYKPVLDSPEDIDAILVLNCIVTIANNRDPHKVVNFHTLKHIINIKCKEFCDIYSIHMESLPNTENFVRTFDGYLEALVESFM